MDSVGATLLMRCFRSRMAGEEPTMGKLFQRLCLVQYRMRTGTFDGRDQRGNAAARIHIIGCAAPHCRNSARHGGMFRQHDYRHAAGSFRQQGLDQRVLRHHTLVCRHFGALRQYICGRGIHALFAQGLAQGVELLGLRM